MRSSLRFLLSFVAFGTTTAMAETYLCIEDVSTGMKYNEAGKVWEQVGFKPRKYVLKPHESEYYKYQVSVFGEADWFALCENGFNDVGIIICDFGGTFRLNRNNMRFLFSQDIAYYLVGIGEMEDDTDSPDVAISIGKCSKI